ncbi:MAG: C45 family peptidase [Candidatus Heimdallarchaeota archaeon]|nr:C45 family peptidase [Candidatus Heimdallarchaeota archaeon]
MKEKLPVIYLSGNAYDIGFNHGKQLKDRIHRTIDFYNKIFMSNQEEIFNRALEFKDVIHTFNPDYCIEIEAIAQGAGIDERWIYALNSRSEILNSVSNECTAFYFKQTNILAQNWDWSSELEDLAVILHITRLDGHQIIMMTEPGIIGKIGMNSAGIGVTLNILFVNQRLNGLPIHITLRALLDTTNIEEGLAKLKDFTYGKASNIIYANADNQGFNLEFAGDLFYKTDLTGEYLFHTNHFLSNTILNQALKNPASSYSRYDRGSEMLSILEDFGIEQAKSILLDKENSELPICRKYIPDELITNSGTVCSIIMDLKNQKFIITKGNPLENDFVTLGFINN